MHYYHPVEMYKMGLDSYLDAVMDAPGQVQRMKKFFVAHASIMPVIPRANTNIPARVVAERVVDWLG